MVRSIHQWKAQRSRKRRSIKRRPRTQRPRTRRSRKRRSIKRRSRKRRSRKQRGGATKYKPLDEEEVGDAQPCLGDPTSVSAEVMSGSMASGVRGGIQVRPPAAQADELGIIIWGKIIKDLGAQVWAVPRLYRNGETGIRIFKFLIRLLLLPGAKAPSAYIVQRVGGGGRVAMAAVEGGYTKLQDSDPTPAKLSAEAGNIDDILSRYRSPLRGLRYINFGMGPRMCSYSTQTDSLYYRRGGVSGWHRQILEKDNIIEDMANGRLFCREKLSAKKLLTELVKHDIPDTEKMMLNLCRGSHEEIFGRELEKLAPLTPRESWKGPKGIINEEAVFMGDLILCQRAIETDKFLKAQCEIIRSDSKFATFFDAGDINAFKNLISEFSQFYPYIFGDDVEQAMTSKMPSSIFTALEEEEKVFQAFISGDGDPFDCAPEPEPEPSGICGVPPGSAACGGSAPPVFASLVTDDVQLLLPRDSSSVNAPMCPPRPEGAARCDV